MQNPSQIDQNGAQERSKSDIGSKLVPDYQKRRYVLLCARSLLAPLGRFWAPFGTQLGAKGLTKSSFLAPSRTKISKNEAQNEASKNI